MVSLKANLDLLKEHNPDRAYELIEEAHQLWTTRSNDLLELFDDKENIDEAFDLKWRAYEWALDNQQFIQQYKKEHPEITYRYFSNE
ncbi:MAG: hypothetical protein CMJ25_00745 [Phycisphaerae bacterium]|nr:hypothetical protein [Phycisphaerae bacterium]